MSVLAAWYDEQGPAGDVLRVGELPTPEPRPGEVRVRVRFSGVNPGDTKKRRGWLGSSLPYPRVVPHSDAAGVVDMVGGGVDARLVGRRVWIYGAQSYRAFGTAAQYVCVPVARAVELPEDVPHEVGACLGIPGITACRAVFGDGSVEGATVLVQGVLGGVGRLAAQLAAWGGARVVIGTVRRSADVDEASATLNCFVALDSADPAFSIREHAPDGVDRVIEVAFSENVDLDAAVIAPGGVIAAYGTGDERPSMPFWPMLFENVTVRLLGRDDFPVAAKQTAAADVTKAASEGALTVAVSAPLPLADVAAAHDQVDAGARKRVLLGLDL